MAMNREPLPNFFVVGAARAGTTSVARYLEDHPQIYMSPVKEPSYFAPDIVAAEMRGRRRRGSGVVSEWESYRKLFRNVTRETAIGEASTAYLISPAAPAAIRRRLPTARIVILLRSPVERAFSTYVMFRRQGRLRASLSEVLHHPDSAAMAEWRRRILVTRKIAPGVERFMEHFPEDRIRWYFHEELSASPVAVMQRIYEFLGVDPDFRPDVSRRFNEGVLPRLPRLHRALHATRLWSRTARLVPPAARVFLRGVLFETRFPARLAAEDRAWLAAYFHEDVAQLARLVNRDLSHWLPPGADASFTSR